MNIRGGPGRTVFLLTVAIVGLALGLFGQGGDVASQPDDPRARAAQYLRENSDHLGLRPDISDLRPIGVRESPSGQHIRYQQTLNGLPVFGAYVTVSLPKVAELDPSLISRYVRHLHGPPVVPKLASAEAIAAALSAVDGYSGDLRAPPSAELAYFPEEDKNYALAWNVTAQTLQPLGSWLIVVDANSGQVISKRNVLRFDGGQVFDPNPAKTSGGTIPPPTDCDSASNESLLAGQYQAKTLQGIQAGQGQLQGDYVDLTAPGISGGYKPAGQADEASHDYTYQCNDDRFEEVMAYYHVDAVQRKIQSLGFSSSGAIIDRPIPVHAHYFSGCNAFFDPVNRGLHFGDSDSASCGSFNADAAEDADVIVHEYGHAIQDDQIPGFAFGPFPQASEALSMGEGFADFLAAAIFGDPCLSEWFSLLDTACDGGTAPGLRWLDNTNVYPADYTACPNIDANGNPSDGAETEEPHCGGLVWGGALWDLVQALGDDQAARDLTLQLVLNAHFFLDPVASFNEAAAAICLADTILYGASHVPTISSVLSARGFSTGSCAASDFPYVYLRILHTWSGDLDINLKVGSDVDAPACSLVIQDGPIAFQFGDLVGYQTPDVCTPFLPPTAEQPWWLEVQDAAALDTGVIENFEVALAGDIRCIATDVPAFIPDATAKPGPDIPGPKVYSMVDCTTQAYPCGMDGDGDGVSQCLDNCPGVANPGQEDVVHPNGIGDHCDDPDDDGSSDFRETRMGTDPDDPCPDDGSHDAWPYDTNKDKKVNVVDLLGLQSFKNSYDSSEGDANYYPRFDFNADGTINMIDLLGLQGFKNSYGTSCGNGTVRIDETGDGPFELTSDEDFHSTFDKTYTLNPTWRVEVTAAGEDNISFKVTCPGLDEHSFDIAHSGGTESRTCADGSKVEIRVN